MNSEHCNQQVTVLFVPVELLSPPPLVLCLIHCPHCSLPSLHPHKTLVQAEVMAHSILEKTGNVGIDLKYSICPFSLTLLTKWFVFSWLFAIFYDKCIISLLKYFSEFI